MSESIAMNKIILSQEQIIQLSNCLSSIEPAIYCDNIAALQTVNSITKKLIKSKAGQAETTLLNLTEPETGVLHILLFLTPLYNTRLEVDEDYDREETWQLNPAKQNLIKAVKQPVIDQFTTKQKALPQPKNTVKVMVITVSFDDITILYMALHQLHLWMGSFEAHPLASEELYTDCKNLYNYLFYTYPHTSSTMQVHQIAQRGDKQGWVLCQNCFDAQKITPHEPYFSCTKCQNRFYNPIFLAINNITFIPEMVYVTTHFMKHEIISKKEIYLYLDFERLYSLYQLLLNFDPQGSQTYSTNADNPMFYAPALHQEKIHTVRSKLIVTFGTKVFSSIF